MGENLEQKKVEIKCEGNRLINRSTILDFQGGLKILPDAKYEKFKKLLLKLGFSEPISVWFDPDGQIHALNGHQRLATLAKMATEGFDVPEEIPVNLVYAGSVAEAKEKLLSLTSQFGEMSGQGLFEFVKGAEIPFVDVGQFNFPEIDMKVFNANFQPTDDEGTGSNESEATAPKKLTDKFIAPPFSILDTKQGYWQDRRRQWLGLGIESEKGRKDNLLGMSKTMMEPDAKKRNSMVVGDYAGGNAFSGMGTSVFDPVLCELMFKWFCPLGGNVLDPFAGGSVRGVVASKLGLHYHGCDLRAEQIEANLEQAGKITPENMPEYVAGDSQEIDQHFGSKEFDFMFSCPPYADLEQYSDDARDISNMDYGDFMEAYQRIISKSVALLKQDAFIGWVVSDVRHKSDGGFYRGLLKDTIRAFHAAGAFLYNDMILLNAIGTTALRAGRTFSATRKVGRIHQNVLVFCKGDVVKAVQNLGEIEVQLPGDSPEGGENIQ